MVKDYYKILQVPPEATSAQLKAAYRRLAQVYHPDKNGNNAYAIAHFNIIKEAYETLTHPVRKEKYLQQRWLYKSQALAFDTAIATPEDLLQQLLLVNFYTAQADSYRSDKEGLYTIIHNLLSDEALATVQQFEDIAITTEIVRISLGCIAILHLKDQLQLLQKLKHLTNDSQVQLLLEQRSAAIQKSIFWNTYQPFFIIVTVITLCIIIALSR